MMFTEQEAKEKWCPFARASDEATSAVSVNRGRGNKPDEYCYCIASACMFWRQEMWPERSDAQPSHEWPLAPTGRGFCGMAGRPE